MARVARVARVVGINGGAQQGQRQSVIRVEAWWQRRTSTSTIQYKNKIKEAVVVVVVQKNEYEYDMIQDEARQWRRRWHTRMCLTSFDRCTEKQRMAPRRFLGFNKGYPETHSKNSIESSSSSAFLSKDHELQKILLDHFG